MNSGTKAWLLVAALITGCHSVPKLPVRASEFVNATSAGTAARDAASLWVSYQIEVTAIDGTAVKMPPRPPGLFWRLDVDPGERAITVRLKYRSATLNVESKPVELILDLDKSSPYRLLNLGDQNPMAPRFDPRIIPGAPD